MGSRALRASMEQLAERYQLTCLEKHKRFRGLHRGISIDVSESDEVMTLAFDSPSADLEEEIPKGFAGFRHCAEAGVPTDWIGSSQERSRHRCLLHITRRRLDLIGLERFLEIPDLVARDLHEHGAMESVPSEPREGGTADGGAPSGGGDASLQQGHLQERESREVTLGGKPRDWRVWFRVAWLYIVLLGMGGILVWRVPTCSKRTLTERVPVFPEGSSSDQGLRAFQRGDYPAAIAAATEAIRLDPTNADAYALRGAARVELGQRQEAIADYTEAIRLFETGKALLFPRSILYSDRGLLFYQMGDYDRAIADCSKALELDPTSAPAYNNRGLALAAKGLHDQAIADFGQAIRLDPSEFKAFANRGRAFLEKRLHDKALPDLTEAIRLNPQVAWVWCCRADARLHRGEYQEALADADQAIRLDPKLDRPFGQRLVATASAKLKKLGEARPARPGPTTATRPKSERRPKDGTGEPTPPSPQRVAARAIVLSALVYRSHLDHYADAPEANVLRRRLLDWLGAVGLLSELEEGEREFLATPLGRAEPQAVIDGEWRAEGLAALAWALKRFELPPHDQRVLDLTAATDAVGFLDDAAAKRFLASAELRPPREIAAFANQITLVSWRLTNFRMGHKGGGFSDLQKFPTGCIIEGWLKGLRLVNGDLAIGGKSLAAASDAERETCRSIARERHVAAYWLEGANETYSLVSADTMPFSRAVVESQRGDPDVAIQVCTKFLELEPQAETWLVSRGWAYLRKSDLAKALADLNRAVELKPDALGHGNRGWAFFHSGDLASAEADAHKALSLDPKDLRPHLLLFRIRAARGERAKAIEEARRVLDTLPTDSGGQAISLVLRHFLGEVPLDTLRNHANWHNFEVAIRGYSQGRPQPRAPGGDP